MCGGGVRLQMTMNGGLAYVTEPARDGWEDALVALAIKSAIQIAF
jgi:hypothetical protein